VVSQSVNLRQCLFVDKKEEEICPLIMRIIQTGIQKPYLN
jgi:hypothetical protein